MNDGRLIFVLEIPPSLIRTCWLAARPSPAIERRCHGDGAGRERCRLHPDHHRAGAGQVPGRSRRTLSTPVNVNPNLYAYWFSSVMQVVNNITMLAVILTGAALIREREQGTVEHLLVMPVVPAEIMLSKTIANGLVILIAAGLSFAFVVQWLLKVPIAGSLSLFLAGATLYISRSLHSTSCSARSRAPWASSRCSRLPSCSSCSFCPAAPRQWRACPSGCNI